MRKSNIKITASLEQELFLTPFRHVCYEQEPKALIDVGAFASEQAFEDGEAPIKTLQISIQGEILTNWQAQASDMQAASDNLIDEMKSALRKKKGVFSWKLPAKYEGDILSPNASEFASWFELDEPVRSGKRDRRKNSANLKMDLSVKEED